MFIGITTGDKRKLNIHKLLKHMIQGNRYTVTKSYINKLKKTGFKLVYRQYQKFLSHSGQLILPGDYLDCSICMFEIASIVLFVLVSKFYDLRGKNVIYKKHVFKFSLQTSFEIIFFSRS